MAQHKGGLVVISHDVELLEAAVNKVWYLDANRSVGRHLQRRLEEVPRDSARPTNGGAGANAPTRRRRPAR
jgi:ATPase subunit of ABC transporter with duplicated ATPase domains